MEQEFVYGRKPFTVDVDQSVVEAMKRSLPFESKSQYYLKIPKQQMINIVFFLMAAKTKTISKKNTNFINTLTGDTKHLFETYFIGGNDKRVGFCGPNELEHLGGAFNNNLVVLQKYQATFAYPFIEHCLNTFKKQEFTVIKQFPSLVHYGADPKIEKPLEVIYIIKSQNTYTLCSYSSGQSKQKKQEVIEQKLKEEKSKKIQKNKEIPKEQKDPKPEEPKTKKQNKPKIQSKPKSKPINGELVQQEPNQQILIEEQDRDNKWEYITGISFLICLALILLLAFSVVSPISFELLFSSKQIQGK